MQLKDFDFFLPPHLIAQTPAVPRDSAKMLYVPQSTFLIDKKFDQITELLRVGDVLVMNNTKVIPALLFGYKVAAALEQQAKISINLTRSIRKNVWQVLAKPAKKLSIGDIIYFDDEQKFRAQVVYKDSLLNEVHLEFLLAPDDSLADYLVQYGRMPLPPYIKRGQGSDVSSDKQSYQTIYAKEYGAVAAPTAGLHFTRELLEKLKNKGIIIAFVTLHVGLGTFSPIKTEDLSQHQMHSEYFTVSPESASLINQAKASNKKVICVGTTSVRAIESCVGESGVVEPHTGETNIFIRPGYQFKVVDSLITNFHLPKSTLFILICAFAGYELMHEAYKHAVESDYRFLYGDFCLEREGYSQISFLKKAKSNFSKVNFTAWVSLWACICLVL